MSAKEWVGCNDLAKLFGVGLAYTARAIPYLEGFPAHKMASRKKLFRLDEVKVWAEGRDVTALIMAAVNRIKEGETEAQARQDYLLDLSRRLHAGEFAPARQRRAIAFRRMAAKVRQSTATRVSIRPDWAL